MASNHLRPQPLPPGVYFSPTREESLGFLDRWIAGDKELPDARGYIFFDDVYRASPDVLRREYTPSSSRAGEHTWWLLSETRFLSQSAGGGTSKRADGSVTTDGYWVMKEAKKRQRDEAGLESGFRFFLDSSQKEKTPWLMQEFTTAGVKDGVACKKGFPALRRVYVAPRATVDELREIYGEDGVPVGPDGKKKRVRAKVPAAYLRAIAALLPPPALRRAGQGHVALPPPPPPPPGQNFMWGASPTNVRGGQYQQKQGQFLEAGAPGQQHGGFLEAGPPLPPPAPPGLLAEVGEDAPSHTWS